MEQSVPGAAKQRAALCDQTENSPVCPHKKNTAVGPTIEFSCEAIWKNSCAWPQETTLLCGRNWSSLVWSDKNLSNLTTTYLFRLDQCAYGLKFEDCGSHEFCRKATWIFTNVSELRQLALRCPGVSPTHQHVYAWGSTHINGKSYRRSTLAGRYPPELCSRWAQIIAQVLCK